VYANGSGFSALAKGALRLAVALIVGGAALSCNSLLSETERLRRKYNHTTITSESPVGPVLSAALNKWVGGVLASNGKIYAIPRSSSSTILVNDTRSVGTLCTPVLESAYFNKY